MGVSSEVFEPRNRKQRRKLAKSFKAFKPKGRDAWRVMNRHMKVAQGQRDAKRRADQSIAEAAAEGDRDGRD